MAQGMLVKFYFIQIQKNYEKEMQQYERKNKKLVEISFYIYSQF